jgi:hypothetical protein
MKNFIAKSILGATVSMIAINAGLGSWFQEAGRHPASAEQPLELSLDSVALDQTSHIDSFKNVHLLVSFKEHSQFEIGRNENIQVQRGESRKLNSKIEIKPQWLDADGSLTFKIEVVENGGWSRTLVRCAQISKEVKDFNRSYQCRLPGETSAFLSYHLAKRGDVAPGLSVAQAE